MTFEPTNFIESNILLAASEAETVDVAKSMLSEMSDTELRLYRNMVDDLCELIYQEHRKRQASKQ